MGPFYSIYFLYFFLLYSLLSVNLLHSLAGPTGT